MAYQKISSEIPAINDRNSATGCSSIPYPSFSLVIPARKEFVSLIRSVLTSVADQNWKLDTTKVEGLILAASEATSNAIESYNADAQSDMANTIHEDEGATKRNLTLCSQLAPPYQSVKMEITESSSEIKVSITDLGPGFNPQALAHWKSTGGRQNTSLEQTTHTRIDNAVHNERGRGLSIIYACVDRVELETTSNGTRITMYLEKNYS